MMSMTNDNDDDDDDNGEGDDIQLIFVVDNKNFFNLEQYFSILIGPKRSC